MKDVRKDHARLLKNLKLLQKIYSAKELMDAYGIKRATWFNKMREPWRQFNYDEFRAIAIYCGVSLETLLEGDVRVI